MSGILCLKWNNHTSTFMKTLDSLRSKELYCDATIVCHGKYFPVHRFVLTTCSEYFEDIFDRMQCKHPFIIIKDLEELQLEALLNYMYKGEVNVVQDKLPGLIKAAESLRVKGLAVSEDEPDKPKSSKDKKRPAPSSPIQSKNRRSAPETFKDKSTETSDEEITEIENISPNSSRQTLPQNITRGYDNNDTVQNDRNEEESTITEPPETIEDEDPSVINDLENESEIEDIKIEPTEIFETVEDFDPGSVESKCYNKTEESLFVSLLSPSSTQLSEEDLIALSEANSHNLPQCSSWSDEISVNSDKIPDDIPGKALWVDSKDFDQLSLDSYACLSRKEKGSTNISSSNVQSVKSKSHGTPTKKKRDLTEKQNEPEASIDLSFLPNSPDFSSMDVLTSNIKEEPLNLDESDFTNPSLLSGIAALSKVEVPESAPNYSSLLMSENQPDNLEDPLAKDNPTTSDDSNENNRKFYCINCPFKCKNKTALNLHVMRRHTGEKPYPCALCSYRCTTKELLKIHTRKHTGERPFSCPYCSCRMSVKSSLKRHILLKHMNAMRMKRMVRFQDGALRSLGLRNNYFGNNSTPEAFRLSKLDQECPQCLYKTGTKSELTKHISYYHSAYKFVCNICQYKCRTNGLLKKHMLKHSKEKPYSCHLCPYKTARKQHLVRHSKLHTGEKPFSCSLCPYKASRKDRLREHLRKHQKNPVPARKRSNHLR